MPHVPTALRRLVLASTAAGALAGCRSSTEPAPITGTYTATTFRITPTGGNSINVLTQGGALSLTITSTNATSGVLTLPASVTGDAALTESMAGTASRVGNTVRFQQSADTFVRDLVWTVNGNTLQANNQVVGGTASFAIVLTRP